MDLQPIEGIPALVAMVAKNVGIFGLVIVVVAYATLAERRVSAFIQDRRGPNRVGPFGLLQPIADGIKNILKQQCTDSYLEAIFLYYEDKIDYISKLLVETFFIWVTLVICQFSFFILRTKIGDLSSNVVEQ